MALDLGTFIGVCVGNEKRVKSHFEYNLETECYSCEDPKKKKINKIRRQKLCHLNKVFPIWLDKYKPDVVVMERPFTRGLGSTRSLWGTAGVIESLVPIEVEMFDVVPLSIKKHFTGSGKSSKEEMIETAKKILKKKELGEHEADAVALWHFTKENLINQ